MSPQTAKVAVIGSLLSWEAVLPAGAAFCRSPKKMKITQRRTRIKAEKSSFFFM